MTHSDEQNLDNSVTPKQCPKCESPNLHQSETCASCGVIFKRYFQARNRRPLRSDRVERRIGDLGVRELGQFANFFRRLERLLGAGGSLEPSLKSAAGSGSPRTLVQKASPYLKQGHGLTKALELSGAVLPGYVWAHLEAGEVSGRLPETLRDLAEETAARRNRILKQIFNWRMLWFFFMLLCAAFSLSITSAVSGINQEEVDSGVKAVLTSITTGAIPRFLLWVLAFTGSCLAFVWFQIKAKAMLTRKYPGFERLRLKLPFFSQILIEESLARYLTLLSRLLEAGLPLPRSLDLAQKDIEFPHWQACFSQIRERVEKGGTLVAGFEEAPHIPEEMLAELRVGESTGGLPEGMAHAAHWLKEACERKRTLLNVLFAAGLFILMVILTIVVTIKGMTSWMPLLDF